MVFKRTLTVRENDLDDLQHVNNVRYVQWIQDISKEHWQTLAPARMQKGIIWVVLNHNITYRSAAQLGDVLRIETHIANSEGATSHRIVEMFNDKTGQLLVHAVTKWCMLNSETQKPMRISGEIKKVFDNGKATS
ncbi:acyl-CoA thioesterase [Flavobacteriaceae bacterium F89]|uniref:Acyl-CoA thioesterase n=1 Tax=Cerina litoralis TaxID=2874477 RepID=A0AAE3EVN7_9FLAO|nr:thioesterase family protein [Cerina litoralis]MCG2461079.1 acyl-CoA thioesterase [Cerina litoralis]